MARNRSTGSGPFVLGVAVCHANRPLFSGSDGLSAEVGGAAFVVEEVIRVEVLAELQIAEVDVGEVHIGHIAVAEVDAFAHIATKPEVRVDGVADGLVGLHRGVAVAGQTGAGRDELTDDDVLLEALEVIDLLVQGGVGEHAGGLLEGGGGQP